MISAERSGCSIKKVPLIWTWENLSESGWRSETNKLGWDLFMNVIKGHWTDNVKVPAKTDCQRQLEYEHYHLALFEKKSQLNPILCCGTLRCVCPDLGNSLGYLIYFRFTGNMQCIVVELGMVRTRNQLRITLSYRNTVVWAWFPVEILLYRTTFLLVPSARSSFYRWVYMSSENTIEPPKSTHHPISYHWPLHFWNLFSLINSLLIITEISQYLQSHHYHPIRELLFTLLPQDWLSLMK